MDSNKFLRDLVESGLKRRRKYFTMPLHHYMRRAKEEYGLVTELGYADYFLIVWDIVRWAKEQGIMVGPARGSVAGSLLAFLINLTDVDPLRFDLMFERFMNPIRAKFDPPDVDLDFQASRREEVKEYIIRKYGQDRVCSIGSHSRAYASGAIKDVAKALGLDFQRLNVAIAHQLYDVSLADAYGSIDSFTRWVDESEEHQECFEIAKNLEGLVRHRSIHPSGLVITPGPVEDYIPVIRVKGIIVTQWKDTWVGRRGLLKVDILGLNTLDILYKTMGFMGQETDLLSIPLDDPRTLELFDEGQTTGVFQFDASHQKRMVERLGVQSFDHIVLAAAISRPGSSRTGIADSVIERKNGREDIEYLHESVRELLADTYGYPVYQELVMKMAHLAGNIPLVDTEIMRDAIKHFRHKVMGRYQQRFKQGAAKNGASVSQANRMWNLIQGASGYGFNKAHATAYSLISYWCGWFKVHYPLEFIGACLACEGSAGKAAQLVSEARRLGIGIKQAYVNKSEITHTVEGKNIRLGLSSIKHVGHKAAKEAVDQAPFSNVSDFQERVDKRKCNVRVVEALQKAGAFGGKVNYDDSMYYYGFALGNVSGLKIADLSRCERCELCKGRNNVVKGDGNTNARIMFVGEAPGKEEDVRGKPFVGRSGRRLRYHWLEYLGLTPADVWITNVVKCIPLDESGRKTETPSSEYIATCSLWLNKEIDIIKPQIIVALGSTALQALSTERSIMSTSGNAFHVVTNLGTKNATGFGLVHPAFTLYRPFDVEPHLDALYELMGEKL